MASVTEVEAAEAYVRSLPESGLSMTNDEYTIDDGLEQALRDGKSGEHTAWNFFGLIWYDQESGEFCELVRRYQVSQAVVRAKSLRELMSAVNVEYGAD